VSFNESVLGPDPEPDCRRLRFATKYMTPEMADDWRTRIQKLLDGDSEEGCR
jgi:hypothetical protein